MLLYDFGFFFITYCFITITNTPLTFITDWMEFVVNINCRRTNHWRNAILLVCFIYVHIYKLYLHFFYIGIHIYISIDICKRIYTYFYADLYTKLLVSATGLTHLLMCLCLYLFSAAKLINGIRLKLQGNL